MKQSSLVQARNRFKAAQNEAAAMSKARYFSELRQSWSAFLMAANGVIEKLERGVKESDSIREWSSRSASERQNDPLLRYIREARNEEYHGLNASIASSYRMNVLPQKYVHLNAVPLSNGDTKFFSAPHIGFDTEGNPKFDHSPELVKEIFVPLSGDLSPVIKSGRKVQTFEVPSTHLGSEIVDRTAFGLSSLMLAYLSSTLSQFDGHAHNDTVDDETLPPALTYIATYKLADSLCGIRIESENGTWVDAHLDEVQLSALIDKLAGIRARMQGQIPYEPDPELAVEVLVNPRWFVRPWGPDSAKLLSIRDPGKGWVHSLIPENEATSLSRYLGAHFTSDGDT